MYQGFVLEMLEATSVPEPLVKVIEHAILKMAGFVSSAVSSLPGFASAVMPSLRPGTPPDVLSALMHALFGWNLKQKLVGMVVSLVAEPLFGENDTDSGEEDQCSSIESAMFGLSLVDLILRDDGLRSGLLSDGECVVPLIEALHAYMGAIEARLQVDEAQLPDQLMLLALDLYYRLLLHVAAISEETVLVFHPRFLTFSGQLF